MSQQPDPVIFYSCTGAGPQAATLCAHFANQLAARFEAHDIRPADDQADPLPLAKLDVQKATGKRLEARIIWQDQNGIWEGPIMGSINSAPTLPEQSLIRYFDVLISEIPAP